ncbi:MAG: DUF4190 domain-containing protein [Clostridia bacterium]|nr:DUF4190 domain-containing protein [Clostridia bacterium]
MDENNNNQVNYGPEPVNNAAPNYGPDPVNPNQQPPVYNNPGAGSEKNGMCTASMICGIIGIVLSCCGCGWLLPIVAIVLGAIGKGKATNPDDLKHAKVGLICGIVGVVISIIMTIISVIYYISGAANSTPTYYYY